ncbi:fasciclin-like arabinogalactan protein 11 [Corylus avellana]|uniref:fasciclin-like arabinogalactan protein 11 n=1 Tax=Corylus avellana TaxID=13451 RepID=UPI001E23C909|nr:fasciclin-like arabinogalactan protein 11 [Corylus avellana]XP_059427762.1 fasciclin-like arabinogalactan protein 11 [Corylus avellana]
MQLTMKQLLQYFPFLLFFFIFFLHSTTTPAHSQAVSPGPSGPTNITGILDKAGQFTTFIRLLKGTQVANQINTQLNNSNQGLTIFAPTDNAFSALKSGTLNSLTDQQKVQLVQFHILPSLFSISQFQTVSNPLRTQAGDSSNGEFPLNVTTSGNQVNLTTGVVDATVANTIFSDSQFAVYQVDKVLLPLDIFGAPVSPAPAPSSDKPEKRVSGSDAPSGSKNDASVDTSGATTGAVSFGGVAVSAAIFCSLWL